MTSKEIQELIASPKFTEEMSKIADFSISNWALHNNIEFLIKKMFDDYGN